MDYKDVIESRYNRKNWLLLLRDIFGNKAKFWSTPYVVDTNSQMAKQALWLGTISLSDEQTIAIYEVELTDKVDIERNRRGIRDMLLTQWRNNGNAGAFMFCYRENESVLRFSYVSESWKFDDDGSYQKESTDTKRFTYLLGEGHRSRTAIQQFETLKGSAQTLKDLTKAFSVDAVSDMFFKDYKEQYADIIFYITGKRMVKKGNKWEEVKEGNACRKILDEFSKFADPEKAVRDYVKKLMGRLVFLQFLQKKGWLGVPLNEDWGNGDHEFIQNLFANTKDKDNFVDGVLEVIFNDLNTEREGDKSKKYKFKIPYLNGGLFERDATDETNFPLPAKYMESMLDFFSQYNFTIDENDPDDAEVGVDPEMLGRIFENLLEDNKDKGAFYTPKEIVQDMCRESLIAYLQTDQNEEYKESIRQFVTTHNAEILGGIKENIDKKLQNVKICDPAIGSGAFPMGLLKELYLCRSAIEGIHEDKASEIKKHIIQNNIYGVDIEKGAVDIARLRFWLSLIVEEKTPHALPNLDFKIMQGNSLLEQYKGVDLSTVTEKKREGEVDMFEDMVDAYRLDLRNLLAQYYDCTDHKEKKALRKKITDNVKQQLLEQGITINFGDLDLAGNDQFFLWHTWFYDVFSQGGFDIVIGNPPYVLINKTIFRELYGIDYKYQEGKIDLYRLFIEKGIYLCSKLGCLSYITPNTFLSIRNCAKLRHFMLEGNAFTYINNYDESIFEASVNSVVFQLLKGDTSSQYININLYSKKQIKQARLEISKVLADPLYEISINADNNAFQIKDKMKNHSILLQEIEGIEMSLGVQPYHNTIHTKEQIKSEYLHSDIKLNSDYVLAYGGKHFSKYVLDKKPKRYINYMGEIYSKPAEKFFNGPRIVIRQIVSNTMICTYINKFALFNNSVLTVIFPKHEVYLKYLLAVLNSKAVGYYISAFGDKSNQTLFPRVSMKMLKQIPVPTVTIKQQNNIVDLVDKILDAKQKEQECDTKKYEDRVDLLIYHLYCLTYDEVLIVDPETPITREEYEKEE